MIAPLFMTRPQQTTTNMKGQMATLIPRMEKKEARSSRMPEANSNQEEVHIRVSAKHMMFASPCFKAMLDKDKFREGSTLRSEGTVQISFPDDNPDAFLILLLIIHGVTKKVLRNITVDKFAKLAILVDKYHESQTLIPSSLLLF
ncbi:hypothetical protein G7Y89_g8875 [Cudoniella acicularis]|uniref:BTB domain-containing protein n=1 Tax=Cudoniella acicularis TaxID=354080 RepID=A0A8H4W069_9HELO|nr:hypothetical protein G7Y89_g8875 [Cudoniella acicularis]